MCPPQSLDAVAVCQAFAPAFGTDAGAVQQQARLLHVRPTSLRLARQRHKHALSTVCCIVSCCAPAQILHAPSIVCCVVFLHNVCMNWRASVA